MKEETSMKKLFSLLLVLMLACTMLPAMAESAPVELSMTLITGPNYNHSDPARDMSVIEAIEKACNVKLNITWIKMRWLL